MVNRGKNARNFFKVTYPICQGVPFHQALRNKFKKYGSRVFLSAKCNELMKGGEVSDLGGAHLHGENGEALTWERRVPKIRNTIPFNMTRS